MLQGGQAAGEARAPRLWMRVLPSRQQQPLAPVSLGGVEPPVLDVPTTGHSSMTRNYVIEDDKAWDRTHARRSASFKEFTLSDGPYNSGLRLGHGPRATRRRLSRRDMDSVAFIEVVSWNRFIPDKCDLSGLALFLRVINSAGASAIVAENKYSNSRRTNEYIYTSLGVLDEERCKLGLEDTTDDRIRLFDIANV